MADPKTLEEQVIEQIGAESPQFENPQDQLDYVEDRLDNMSARELLAVLSYTFDWSHLKQS